MIITDPKENEIIVNLLRVLPTIAIYIGIMKMI